MAVTVVSFGLLTTARMQRTAVSHRHLGTDMHTHDSEDSYSQGHSQDSFRVTHGTWDMLFVSGETPKPHHGHTTKWRKKIAETVWLTEGEMEPRGVPSKPQKDDSGEGLRDWETHSPRALASP